MGRQVTLTLSNELYERASQWATFTQRDLSGTITDASTILLTPLPAAPRSKKKVSSLSDEKVLALSKAQMKAEQGQRLGDLLEKQREGTLTESERPELARPDAGLQPGLDPPIGGPGRSGAAWPAPTAEAMSVSALTGALRDRPPQLGQGRLASAAVRIEKA